MILIDSHVHIYDCFNLAGFFDAALANFRRQTEQAEKSREFSAFLLLTEAAGVNWFARLAAMADGNEQLHGMWHPYSAPPPSGKRLQGAGDARHRSAMCTGVGVHEQADNAADSVPCDRLPCAWSFHRTSESFSLLAEHRDGGKIYLVAGRQIVTAENLEVLALLTEAVCEEGLPLATTVDAVRKCGAIPVVPWGTGKWFGTRGRLLQEYMVSKEHDYFFLGDNSGRPFFWPYPSLLSLAASQGYRILSGSDPLPFPSEASKPGSFGVKVAGFINDRQFPAACLKAILLDGQSKFEPFGRLETAGRFFYHQLAMQLEKKVAVVVGRALDDFKAFVIN